MKSVFGMVSSSSNYVALQEVKQKMKVLYQHKQPIPAVFPDMTLLKRSRYSAKELGHMN